MTDHPPVVLKSPDATQAEGRCRGRFQGLGKGLEVLIGCSEGGFENVLPRSTAIGESRRQTLQVSSVYPVNGALVYNVSYRFTWTSLCIYASYRVGLL